LCARRCGSPISGTAPADPALKHVLSGPCKSKDREEEVPGAYVYNGRVANKALELIGKELGMFIDRKEVGEPNEFARMSDEELDAFIRGSIEPLSLHNGLSKL